MLPRGLLRLAGAAWFSFVVGFPARAFGARAAEDLERRQADVKGLLRDVAGRMETLAKRIEATEPEEARRIRQAAERVRISGLDGLLEEISRLIADRNFVEAVGKQDLALKELDGILAILEDAKFRDLTGDAELQWNEAARKELERIVGKQEKLLRKTREHLAAKAAKEALRGLAREISKLEKDQSGLNEGSVEAVTAEFDRRDEEALERAEGFLEKLLEAQRRLTERARSLGETASAASRASEAAKEIEKLLEEAQAEAAGEGAEAEEKAEPEGSALEKRGKESAKGSKGDPGRAESFVRRLEAAARGFSSEREVPGEAKKALEEAASSARKALESRKESPVSAARSALERAARAASKAARSLRDAVPREAASAAQVQGLLEAETSEGSKRLEQDAGNASAEPARRALSRASADLERAAASMRSAADSLSEGASADAEKSGAQAEKNLESAMSALREGREGIAARTREEKARDAQEEVARRTERLKEEVERLEKKLGRKDAAQEGRFDSAKKALSGAAASMRESAKAWQGGDSPRAKQRGEESLANLSAARKALGDAERNEPSPESLEDASKEQDELARLTRQTARRLESAPGGSRAESENLDSAAGSMESAGKSLAGGEAEDAEKKQEDALERLGNSRRALEKRAEELARLNRERQVLSILEELSRMREAEEDIYKGTVDLDARRSKEDSRRQRLLLRQRAEELAESQGALAERVDGLREKLKAELSRVFSFALGNIGADMRQIRDALKELDVGSYTQFLERNVLDDLAQLIRALEDEIRRLREAPQQGQMPMGEENRRLVPLVAELRMLKEMQLEVNRRTRSLEDLRQASDGKISEPWEQQLDRLLQKQGTVSRLTRELVEDFENASREAGGAPGREE